MIDLHIRELLKAYGKLLTENQYQTAVWYYDIDLTISEIASESSVSRQSVNDTLSKVKQVLEKYEQNLQLVKKKTEILKVVGDTDLKKRILEILEA